MQKCYVYHGKKEQKKLIDKFTGEGYKNVQNLTWEKYKFPVIVVDEDKKEFFGTNTTCMAGFITSKENRENRVINLFEKSGK